MNNTEKSVHAGHSESSHFFSGLLSPTRAVWTPLWGPAASPAAGFSSTPYLAPINSVPKAATLPPSRSSPSPRQVL